MDRRKKSKLLYWDIPPLVTIMEDIPQNIYYGNNYCLALNNLSILHGRSSVYMQVRYALLKVLQEIYTKLGEEFMVLLPETIPFLAELLEGEYILDDRIYYT